MSSYKLKVKLKGIEPAVTSTISVPKDITFRDLHNILQVAMGWKGMRSYEFQFPSNRVVIGPVQDPYFDSVLFDGDTYVSDYEGLRIRYMYDRNDPWVHEMHFLKDTELDVPKVLKYEGDCPLECFGGCSEYPHLMTILSDPTNPEYVPTKLTYDRFHVGYDIDAVNEHLEKEWVPYDPSSRISEEVFHEICNAFELFDGKDRYFDLDSMKVVELKAGKKAQGWADADLIGFRPGDIVHHL